jgi:hypothetical protein
VQTTIDTNLNFFIRPPAFEFSSKPIKHQPPSACQRLIISIALQITSANKEALVSRDRRVIREKIETESNIRKWFQDLTLVALTVAVFSHSFLSRSSRAA